jgi:hypothetical protein
MMSAATGRASVGGIPTQAIFCSPMVLPIDHIGTKARPHNFSRLHPTGAFLFFSFAPQQTTMDDYMPMGSKKQVHPNRYKRAY